MFHRLLTPLLFVAFLFVICIGPSACRYLSRRATPPHATYARRRLARRSFSSDHSPPQRRSISSDDDPFSDPFPFSDIDNLRRSLNLDEVDDGSSPPSTDQTEAEADQLWQEFVAPTSGEDTNSYPEYSDPDENADNASGSQKGSTPSSCSPGTNSGAHPENTSSSLVASENGENSQSVTKNPSQQTSEITKKKEAEKEQAKKEADDAKAQKEAEKAKAQKEAEAAAEKRKEAHEEKDREAAQAKKDADENPSQPTTVDTISPPKKNSDSYQATPVQKNPALPVSTGIAHVPNNGNTYSPPSSEQFTGDATFYEPNLGACGVTNKSTDMIVAVSMHLYDTFPSEGGNPNTNKVCGRKIRATYKGRSVVVVVTDRCEGCDKYSLDFTLSAFEKLGTQEEGRLHGMTWNWV